MTEQEIRNKVVTIAKGWLGCKESNGTHRKIIDLYNSHKPLARGYKVKYTDAWCATFVSAVAIKAGLTDIIPTECGCNPMIQLFKNMGCWVENDAYVPKPADIIFYDWEDSGIGDNVGSSDHVGIVVSVAGDTIQVIEGNKSNSVDYRPIKVNGRYIRGYGCPKYSKYVTTTVKKTIDEIAREVLDGKWGNGAERQSKLTAAGYNYADVQKKVNELLKSKKSINDIAKEVIDGKWGNGLARKTALEKAGYNYAEVQAKVNQLLKK